MNWWVYPQDDDLLPVSNMFWSNSSSALCDDGRLVLCSPAPLHALSEVVGPGNIFEHAA